MNQPSILEKSATARVALRISFSSFRRFSRTFGIVVIDLDLVEERIDRGTQRCHRAHGAGEVFLRHGDAGFHLHQVDRVRQRLLFVEAVERRRRARRRSVRLSFFSSMREDVAGALGAGEQVLAVIGVEEFAERLDAADDHQEIVLAAEREHGIDEIVPRALLAELDFQAVGEEGEKIG